MRRIPAAPSRLFYISLLGLLIVLAGCATAPEEPKPADAEAEWALRKSILSQQQAWWLTGKVAVRTEEDGWTAGLRWLQVGEQFEIDLLDPFGRIVARIKSGAGRVTLTQRDGGIITAADAESLMRELYGWALPLSGLRYWVLGIPEPNIDTSGHGHRSRIDAYGRLTELNQAGWAVDYEQYQDIEPVDLPEEIALSNHSLKARLIVKEWHLSGIPEATDES
jgi:outer membrane lipoprotein LolB